MRFTTCVLFVAAQCGLVALAGLLATHVQADEPSYDDRAAIEASAPRQLRQKPRDADAYLDSGRRLYLRFCAPCHGEQGRGDGPAADVMRPRPRDFTSGNFALRSTRSGELPTDADLFVTVSRGVPGTAMPAWGQGIFQLSETERWQVIYYVKHLNGTFWDAVSDPYRAPAQGEPEPRLRIGTPPQLTPALLERGRLLYLDQTKGGCVRCHGTQGRGDGPAAAQMLDDLGEPVRPYDLTNPWRNKNGRSLTDLFRTLSTGLSGTPMADFSDGVPDEQDRWALAMYAQSLLRERTSSQDPLVAHRARGPLPDDPDAPAWQTCKPFGIPLMGQYSRAPRWQAPSVDYVRVCALYDERAIALRIEWDDPFRDDQSGARPGTTTQAASDGAQAHAAAADAPGTGSATNAGHAYLTITEANTRAKQRLIPDALYVQMPAGERAASDAQRPMLLMGDPEHPIDVWTWSALEGGRVDEAYAEGVERGYQERANAATRPRGKSRWSAGHWRVVMQRALRTGDEAHATHFGPGALVPFNLRVWDGSAGEEGLQCATSAWRHIYLETPAPIAAYLRGLFAALLGYVVVGFVWRRLRRD